MQAQTFATVPVQANIYDVASSLESRQDHAHVMKAPYTVLVKKITENYYLWVVYSWPRPYNAIWGEVVVVGDDGTINTDIKVNYGCSWKENLTIVHDILKYRKRDGFSVVSTLSKDRVNSRILGNLIKDAYENGADVQYSEMMGVGGAGGMIFISNQDILDQLLTKMYDQSEFNETNEVVERISQEIASDHLTNPNLSQYVTNSSGVHQNIVDKIHDFLEHSTATNGDIKVKCQLYIACKDESIDGVVSQSCDLYRPGWADSLDESGLR
jgi:hypothetical protein